MYNRNSESSRAKLDENILCNIKESIKLDDEKTKYKIVKTIITGFCYLNKMSKIVEYSQVEGFGHYVESGFQIKNGDLIYFSVKHNETWSSSEAKGYEF